MKEGLNKQYNFSKITTEQFTMSGYTVSPMETEPFIHRFVTSASLELNVPKINVHAAIDDRVLTRSSKKRRLLKQKEHNLLHPNGEPSNYLSNSSSHITVAKLTDILSPVII